MKFPLAWAFALIGGLWAVGIMVWIEPASANRARARRAIAVDTAMVWFGLCAVIGVGGMGFSDDPKELVLFASVCALAAVCLFFLRSPRS